MILTNDDNTRLILKFHILSNTCVLIKVLDTTSLANPIKKSPEIQRSELFYFTIILLIKIMKYGKNYYKRNSVFNAASIEVKTL